MLTKILRLFYSSCIFLLLNTLVLVLISAWIGRYQSQMSLMLYSLFIITLILGSIGLLSVKNTSLALGFVPIIAALCKKGIWFVSAPISDSCIIAYALCFLFYLFKSHFLDEKANT